MKYYRCIKNYYHVTSKFAKVDDIIEEDEDGPFYHNKMNNRYVNKKDIPINDTFFFVPINSGSEDKVNSPNHYTWLKDKCGIEVIDITRWLDFDTGNAVKYLLRAGYKSEEGYSDKEKEIEDLKKAVWYINDKIKMIESNG